jgi:lysozyme
VNIPALVESLIAHEDERLKMYYCSANKPTIGVGHNLERPISQRASRVILDDDIADAIAEMDRAFPGWRSHSEVRQNVLVELCFNLGAPTLSNFLKFWAALRDRNYKRAAAELLNSKWRQQVGQRAVTLAARMETDSF